MSKSEKWVIQLPKGITKFYIFSILVSLVTVSIFIFNYRKYASQYHAQVHGDTTTIRKLFDSSFKLAFVNPDSGLIVGKAALDLSQHSNWVYGEALSNNAIASNYFSKSNLDSALMYYLNALYRNLQINNRISAAANYNNLGSCFIEFTDYKKGLRYLDSAAVIYEAAGPNYRYHSASVYLNKGAAYNGLKQYKNGIIYARKAIDIFHSIGEKIANGDPYNNLANALLSEKADYALAFNYYDSAEIILKEANPVKLASIKMNKGLIFLECPDPVLIKLKTQNKDRQDSANHYFLEAKKLASDFNDQYTLAYIYLAQSDLYVSRSDYKNAFDLYVKYNKVIDSLTQDAIRFEVIETESKLKEEMRLTLEKEAKESAKQKYYNTFTILFPIIPLILIICIILTKRCFGNNDGLVIGIAEICMIFFSEVFAFWLHFSIGHGDMHPLLLFGLLSIFNLLILNVHHLGLGFLKEALQFRGKEIARNLRKKLNGENPKKDKLLSPVSGKANETTKAV